MAQYDMTPDTVFRTPYAADERVTAFLRSVYGWMCAGLGITAFVAFLREQALDIESALDATVKPRSARKASVGG